MKAESIQRKALDAAQKYAERKHRQRAMTIAQTELAFAYIAEQIREYGRHRNRGYSERQLSAGSHRAMIQFAAHAKH